jgi:putative two-component system response regulator
MMRGEFPSAHILVVDDQESNVRLLERLLENWGYANVVSTTRSAEVPELFAANEPDLLVLDLQMPPPDGFALLEQLPLGSEDGAYLPVLILTGDITREARERALSLGATDFLSKPFDAVEVRLRIANLLEIRRLTVELREQNRVLEERVLARTRDLDQARLETLERLAIAAEYRDDTTHEHAERVGRSAAVFARDLGLPVAEVEAIRRAAPLHDIGKIGIPDAILLKPGTLTTAEFEVMKTHSTIGRQILAGSGSDVLQLAEEIALTHHERWDGSGYPHGFSGAMTPLVGRLVALADVFDALTHDRPYKQAWPIDAAAGEIVRLAGSHFDPSIVDVFEQLDPAVLLAPVAPLGARDY